MINMAQILGRVGKMDVKNVRDDFKVANLSIVTNKKFVKNGEKQEKVTWHNVTLFNKVAEIAEKYVAVGDLLYIQGEMDSQKYTDNNGQERTKFFILGTELKLMPKSKESKSAPQKQNDPTFEDDLIPF